MIYELSQQRVGLMNKSYRYVGYCLVRPYRYGLAEIGAVCMLLACFSCLHCLSAVDAPLFKISYSQIVFIINQKFLQTGFCNVCKLQFGLSPGAACCASLGNILLARVCSQNHLVDGSVGLVEIFMRKIKNDVINTFSLLINNKLSVVSALLNTVVFHVFLLQVKCRVLRLVVKVKNDL